MGWVQRLWDAEIGTALVVRLQETRMRRWEEEGRSRARIGGCLATRTCNDIHDQNRLILGERPTNLKGVSQSPRSCPFHEITSRMCRIPLSRQFSSRMQSRTVCEGSTDGKGFIKGFPSTRDRNVVFGTSKCMSELFQPLMFDRDVPTPATPDA